MKKKKRKVNKKSIFVLILTILSIFACIFSVYSLSLLTGIETLIRMSMCGIIIVLMIALVVMLIKALKDKKKKHIGTIILSIIYSVLLILFGYYVFKTYSVVENFTSDSTTYSSSIVTLESNKATDIKDVDGKVGILSDESNVAGNVIPNEVIKSEKLDVDVEEYDTYVDLVNAL